MKASRQLGRAIALVVALTAAVTAVAQTPALTAPPANPSGQTAASTLPANRPRIGLALSGGGARGIAHIGVLKVLEEMRIPISCVTGTSMGAIVGGTFASGRSPEEMEKFVLGVDWDEVFRDKPPRNEIAVKRKIDDYKTLFAPEFGVKSGGLVLPKGVLAGVSIESFFRELAAPSFGITDFRKLPIPFVAIATNIETGQAVVLDRGSLAEAMRASMSVPGAMSPVEIDGKLLVDGGIADNLPIDQARKLCADVIIAVNISTPPLTRAEITSALSVVGQLINFLGKQTVDEQLKSLTDKDVLITPDLGDISATKFDRSPDAIRIGEQATRALADKLRRYSLPPEQYAALRATQVSQARALGTVDEIRIEGLQKTNPAVVRGLIQSKPGEPLSEEKASADLRRIFGTGDYESINARIIGGDGSPRVAIIEPKEKSWGPDYLRFGVGLASDFQGDSQFNALVQYRKTWLNSLGAEWTTQLQIGQDTHLATEFRQPFTEDGNWFIAPNGVIGRQTRPVFVDGNKVAEYNISSGGGELDFGRVFGTWGELRVGPVWSKVYARVETGSPLLPTVREPTAGLRATLFVDQTDRAWYPSSGYALTGSAYAAMTSFGSAHNYDRLEGRARGIWSWDSNTFNLAVSGGTALGTDMPAYDSFTLGGPLRLSGYQIDEFAGRDYAFGRLMYYRRIFPLPDILGSGAFLGGSAEVGRMTNRFINSPTSQGTLWSTSVFLGADTFLGPAYLGFGYAGSGNWSLYLLLGAP
jgi:NTE family protein